MNVPVFIDAVHAAEMLHVSQDAVLDLVKQGRLRAYGGRASNPFLRSADVSALVPEFHVPDESAAPRRVKSASARVRQRLTADARWADVTEEDVRDWADRSDRAARQAARTAALTAQERLGWVLRILDESGS